MDFTYYFLPTSLIVHLISETSMVNGVVFKHRIMGDWYLAYVRQVPVIKATASQIIRWGYDPDQCMPATAAE